MKNYELEYVELQAISLVKNPATEINGHLYEQDGKVLYASIVMPSDKPILRRDIIRGEHYISFKNSQIRNIAYSKDLKFNLHHTDTFIDDIYMVETYIVDRTLGIYPPKGFNVKDGSWVCILLIDNPDVVEQIKQSKINGLSVEVTVEYKETVDDYLSLYKILDSLGY